MWKLEDKGIIFPADQQPSEKQIAYFTSLCLLRSGNILCGFQNGPSKHSASSTIGLCKSTNQGQDWETLNLALPTEIDGTPGSFSGGELLEAEPGRLLMFATWFDRSDPERPLFDPVTEGILKSKELLFISADEGETWSAPRVLSTGELTGCATTGPAIQWSDGSLAYAFESFKEYDDPRPGRHAAWVLVSRDGGETFSPPLLIAQHPAHQVYYWDQRLCASSTQGEFTAMFWTHHLAEQRDLNVHLLHSKIEGDQITSGSIQSTTIPGQIAAPVRLDDQRLLTFVVDRTQPGTMTLWSSTDNGSTWPSEQKLVVHKHDEQAALTQGRENIDFKQYWEDMGKWSFGHPAIRLLPNGRVLLAWYAGHPTCMSLHWARVHWDE